MRGHIVKRNGKRKINGKLQVLYYAVLAFGDKRKWETVPPPQNGVAPLKNAEIYLAKRLAEIEGGEYLAIKKITFANFIDLWVEQYAQSQVRPSTMATYKGFFKNHFIPVFGDKQLSAITVEDVQSFKSAKLSQPKDLVTRQIEGEESEDKKPLSTQTVKHLLRLLRQMLNHAVEWGYLKKNPALKVVNPKVKRKEMECYAPTEVRVFLEHVAEEWQAFFLCAISSGLRIGELMAMRWANLDRRNGQYFVKETWLRPMGGQSASFAEPKTDSSIAPVDLIPEALDALSAHQKRQAAQKLKAGEKYQDQDLIFATATGGPLDNAHIVQRVYQPTVKEAGLRQIRFHDLRHTTAALLIEQKESPKYIQKQLRHASIEITFDRYGHLFPDANRAAAKRLSETIFGKPVIASDLTSV